MAKKVAKKVSQISEQAVFNAAVSMLMSIPEVKESMSVADVTLALEDVGWIRPGDFKTSYELDPKRREDLVQKSRAYWAADPLAKQAVRLWTSYAIGTGITYKLDDEKDTSGTKKEVDSFWKFRKNKRFTSSRGQQRLSRKLLIDGEIFFAIVGAEGSPKTIRTIDPLQIVELISDAGDEENVLAYKRIDRSAERKTFYYRDWAAETGDLENLKDADGKVVTPEENVRVFHLAFDDLGKFATASTEIFYMGEYVNGDTVARPVSPIDGHTHTYAETKFIWCWRWTTDGSQYVQPPITVWPFANNIEQLGPFRAAINSSNGAVSVSVDMIGNGGQDLTTLTNYGRIAVFAFCRRSATPASLTLANSFTELDPGFFFPGETLRASTLQTVEANIREAILTPEFFGPTSYHDGDTVPTPTSPVDGYAYGRSELTYIITWEDTTNQTGSHLRLPLFTGNINMSTGLVTLETWRLPPGGPYVDDNNTLCTIKVIVVAHRQANHGSVTAPGGTVVPTGASSAVVDGTDIQVNGTAVPDIANFNDTLPAAPSGYRNAKWQQDTTVDPDTISTYFPNIGGVDARTTATETIAIASQGKLVTLGNASATAVTLDSTVPNTFFRAFHVKGAGTCTFTPSSGTINGLSTLTVVQNQNGWLFFDGTDWHALIAQGLVMDEIITPSGASGTLSRTPLPSSRLQLYVDGQLLTIGAGNDFTISGTTITFATAPRSGANVRAIYPY